MKRWSRRWHWRERSRAWDGHMEHVRREAAEDGERNAVQLTEDLRSCLLERATRLVEDADAAALERIARAWGIAGRPEPVVEPTEGEVNVRAVSILRRLHESGVIQLPETTGEVGEVLALPPGASDLEVEPDEEPAVLPFARTPMWEPDLAGVHTDERGAKHVATERQVGDDAVEAVPDVAQIRLGRLRDEGRAPR